MEDWNVVVYHQFEQERTQPCIDLLNRIEEEAFKRILDVGCGSGLSTLQVVRRWPDAQVIGVDYSASMLEKARSLQESVQWIQKDCNQSLEELGQFNLILANASLQWLDDHESVINEWFARLEEGGVIALQIPSVDKIQLEKCLGEIRTMMRWQSHFSRIQSIHCGGPDRFYNLFCKKAKTIQLWETDYYHPFKGHEEIIDFYKSTGLRPYLNALESKVLQEHFLDELYEALKRYYPTQEDGRVLFVMKRIFIIAHS